MTQLLLATLLLGATPTPSADTWLAEVAAAYRQGGDFEAHFTQSYTDKLRPRARVESGTLWVKSDGRVRWSYRVPEVKDFVFDGEKAYFYEPENAQVTVFDNFEKSPLWTALRFLWGQGQLGELFHAGLCQERCGVGEKGDAVLTLTPREPMPTVERAMIAIDPKTKRVREALVVDPLGNRTTYRFSDFRFGLRLEAARFRFEIPAGVSVLRPAAETP